MRTIKIKIAENLTEDAVVHAIVRLLTKLKNDGLIDAQVGQGGDIHQWKKKDFPVNGTFFLGTVKVLKK